MATSRNIGTIRSLWENVLWLRCAVKVVQTAAGYLQVSKKSACTAKLRVRRMVCSYIKKHSRVGHSGGVLMNKAMCTGDQCKCKPDTNKTTGKKLIAMSVLYESTCRQLKPRSKIIRPPRPMRAHPCNFPIGVAAECTRGGSVDRIEVATLGSAEMTEKGRASRKASELVGDSSNAGPFSK